MTLVELHLWKQINQRHHQMVELALMLQRDQPHCLVVRLLVQNHHCLQVNPVFMLQRDLLRCLVVKLIVQNRHYLLVKLVFILQKVLQELVHLYLLNSLQQVYQKQL